MNSEINKKILSDITVHMKYAKYVPELNRRETWKELVTRNKEMHQKRYPELKDEIQVNYKYVYDKKVLPSMRSFSSAVSQLRSRQIDYTIVATYLLITLIALASLCFFCYLVAVLVTRFNNIITNLPHITKPFEIELEGLLLVIQY